MDPSPTEKHPFRGGGVVAGAVVLWVVVAVVAGAAVVGAAQPDRSGTTLPAAVPAVALAALSVCTVWVIRSLRTAAVATDRNLVLRGVFRSRRVPWSQIEGVHRASRSYGANRWLALEVLTPAGPVRCSGLSAPVQEHGKVDDLVAWIELQRAGFEQRDRGFEGPGQ